MKCPTIDKLSQYADDLCTGRERENLHNHIESCAQCQRVVEAFIGEQQFLKETLQTPTLPDDFTVLVLDQLEPYERKKKRPKMWKRVLLSAAGMGLAVGISATLSPSFAEWVGSIFSTEQVDEGIRMATDAGLAERVNLEATDNGITLKVEDIIADSSRVTLSYQLLDKKGKPIHWFDIYHRDNKIISVDQKGKEIEHLISSWGGENDYGLIEFSLREQEALESLMIKFDVVELNGVKGNWQLDIPVELKDNRALTKIVSLKDAATSMHGVKVQMKEVQYAPSSTELLYETGFTPEVQEKVNQDILLLSEKYGEEVVHGFTNYESAINYHIENEDKEVVHTYQFFNTGEERTVDSAMLQGTGRPLESIGGVAWNESFVPQQNDSPLTFVLDGVVKTVPTDYAVTIKPKELRRNPVTFEYEGNNMTITEAKKHTDFYLRKSFLPIGKRTSFKIKMAGENKAFTSELGVWALVDDQGKSYVTYGSGSTIDYTLTIYGLDKVPEEFTLHLLSVKHYMELEEKWEVPLYVEK